MHDSPALLRPLSDLADTNPEALGSGADPHSSFKYIDLSSVNAGTIGWNFALDVTLLTAPSRARRVLRHGDVLFGTVRPNLQSHGYVDWTGRSSLVGSTGFSVLRAKRGICDSRYLFHCIMSNGIAAQANRDAVGSSYPALNDSDVRRFEIFAPPIGEQIAISDVLDTLDTTIYQTEAIIEKLKQVKQGLLHDLLTRGIDANGELRPLQSEAPHLYRASPVGWIPHNWRCETVKSALDGEPRNGIYKPPGQIGFGVLLVGQTAFTPEGSIDFRQVRRARASHAECEAFGLRGGDLLVSRVYATRDGVGQPVIVPEHSEPAVFESNMMRLRTRRNVMEPHLLFLWLKHQTARAWIMSRAFASNQASINRETICSAPIPLPPKEEQEAILAIATAHDTRLEREMLSLAKARKLKQGLTDDLLTGRVRVTPLLT